MPNILSGTPGSIKELLKKATTEMLLLRIIKVRPMYTYEMMLEIEKLSDGAITFNTLYQAIYRLQGNQYITEYEKRVVDNRIRIYFAITREGEIYLDQLIAEYRAYVEAVNRILQP